MMRSNKTVLFALALSAFAAYAAPVSKKAAMSAASSLASGGAPLGVRLVGSAVGAEEHVLSGGASFYVVRLDGGTVFVAGDDAAYPIVAFTSATAPDLSEDSPLRLLLEKDAVARASLAAMADEPAAARAKTAWTAVTQATASAAPIETVAGISDLRVAPLLKTKWSQTAVNGEYCYNYYTPNHYPCGCTATAAAQIMRMHEHPSAELPATNFVCIVDGTEQELYTHGDSRLYDWSNMPLVPSNGVTAAQRAEIGSLTYDIGVALRSDYADDAANAYITSIGAVFRDVFDYANAWVYWNAAGWSEGKGGLHLKTMREKIIYANLDAGLPVQLAIYGYAAGHVGNGYYWAGHSVVADGYGFVSVGGEPVEYVHINMGWAGLDDLWYNIPEINATHTGATVGQKGYDFLFMGGAAYNMMPTASGEILSGRVIDDGDPAPGATVEVRAAGADELLGSTIADEHGVYSFILPGGASYDVSAASVGGDKFASLDGVFLPASSPDSSEIPYVMEKANHVGNLWGNDLDVVVPCARIGETSYTRLEKALDVANGMTEPVVVELIAPSKVRAAVTVSNNVTIAAASADPSECTMTIASAVEGEWLHVTGGARVLFTNAVFSAESGAPSVKVDAGSSVAVAGTVSVGVVSVGDSAGIVVAGPLEVTGDGIGVTMKNAANHLQFGVFECDAEVAAAAAPKIVSMDDATLAGTTGDGGVLVWDRQSVDPSVAYACANGSGGVTYYRSLDTLFLDYGGGGVVTILKDCPEIAFTNAVTVTGAVTLNSGEGGPFAVALGKNSAINVGAGGSLTVEGVTFSREKPSGTFITVSGGGSVTLGDGAKLTCFKLTKNANVVNVASGTFEMLDGSEVSDCAVTTTGGSGCAVRLASAGCVFDFKGGSIARCSGNSNYGAVYAGSGSTVKLSGSAKAGGNVNSRGVANDIYIYADSAANSPLVVTGLMTGGVGVMNGKRASAGQTFATVASGVSAADAEASCSAIFSNTRAAGGSALVAVVSSGGGTLEWKVPESGVQPVAEADAEASVGGASGTSYYATLADAFAVASGNAVITLLADATLTNSVTIADGADIVLDGAGMSVSLVSAAGGVRFSVTNASFSVTNVSISAWGSAGRVVSVVDGSFAMRSDSAIVYAHGNTQQMVAPVVVWGGTFTMENGALISSCENLYERKPGDALTAGAVVVSGRGGNESAAYLNGGEIAYCSGLGVGGVYIGNGASAYVKGSFKMDTCENGDGEDSNLVVHDTSRLVLADAFDGGCGFTEGISADTNVFGVVDAAYAASATESNLVVSARRFVHDVTGSRGIPVTDGTEVLLVWKSSVGKADVFTNVVDGVEKTYDVLRAGLEFPEDVECQPFTFTSIERTAEGGWKLTLKPGVAGCTYTLYRSDVPVSPDSLGAWTQVGSPVVLEAGDINGAGEFSFTTETGGDARFWIVIGK